MMKGALRLLGIFFLSLSLTACGGGSDGTVATPPLTATLTGTVTDSSLEPVAGVTVTVQGVTTTLTNAAGRYTVSGLTATSHRVSFTPPANNHFPASATVALTGGKTTALDIFLARANGQSVAAAGAGGTITSNTFINAVQQSTFVLAPGDAVENTGASYNAPATVYVAPIDVGKEGHGLASYQSNLGNVFTALTGSTSASSSLELYAAAAVAIKDNNIPANTLALLDPGSTSTLTLPIPPFPAEIRTNAQLNGPTADLWYYDESTGGLVKHATHATYNAPAVGDPYFLATIDRPGIWMAGFDVVTPETITGTLRFSNGAAATGATVYAVGDDHGFTNITTTNSSGAFSLTAKSGSNLTLHFVVYANGAQWPHEVSLTALNAANAAMGNVPLLFTPPASGLTITIDNNSVPAARLGPDQLGFIVSSGRQIRDDSGAAGNVADVTFLANGAGSPYGTITMTPTQSGCGIQVVAGTFAALTTAPAAGYVDNTAIDPASWTIADLDDPATTLPILVAVEIPADKSDPLGPGKHYAKISIDSVTNVSGTTWKVNFRSAFSLTGNF